MLAQKYQGTEIEKLFFEHPKLHKYCWIHRRTRRVTKNDFGKFLLFVSTNKSRVLNCILLYVKGYKQLYNGSNTPTITKNFSCHGSHAFPESSSEDFPEGDNYVFDRNAHKNRGEYELFILSKHENSILKLEVGM
jgi:hypothetical protein